MFPRYFIRMICFTIILLLFALPLHAKSISVELKSQQVQTVSQRELSEDAYILDITIPEDVIGKRLDAVLLELYVDVSLKSDTLAHSPVIEFCPLKEAFDGANMPDYSVRPSMVRNVRVGTGRRVIMDITEIVKEWVTNPGTNKGIIVGSLTGFRSGVFVLRNDVVGNGVIAKVKYCYQNRFGNRVSQGR